ncbi:hypothetical protein N750_02320 [Legionella pneumophila str. Leg01/53]|nr:hypothetical protein N750_02320 [Legionella pneumophila str. Leg01/53]ERI47297.1 hypothetical protein N749_14790 [Legionella pneumophila str. Leg01/20]
MIFNKSLQGKGFYKKGMVSNTDEIKNKDKLSTESGMLVKVWDAHYDNKKKNKKQS